MTKYFTALLFLVAWPSFAADLNGYTTQYECRAGGTNCNVDVASLARQSCQQTISTSMSWSSINWSNNVICIEAGDHTAKGTLTLGSSGTSGTRKVLRYTRTNDNDDEPWNQGNNQAKIKAMDTNGNDYWIVQRITIDPNTSGSTVGLNSSAGSSYNIFNRMLIQRTNAEAVVIDGDFASPTASTNNTLQNSVIRSTVPSTGAYESQCVTIGSTANTHLVNNEEYDCNKGSHIPGNTSTEGVVIENSDIYVSPDGRTDCNGNYTPTGNCSRMEALISWKSGGTSGNPNKIIHNRLWGGRYSDGNLIQAGDMPDISISNQDINGEQNPNAGADYVLVQNNIIFDSELGIMNYWDGPDHNSVIGNILYDLKCRRGSCNEAGGLDFYRIKSSEFYLNTIVDATPWLTWGSGVTNSDMRCNVVIASGSKSGSSGSGTQIDYNAYYDATNSDETTKLVSNGTRANSRAYSIGATVFPATRNNYIYLATTTGTTAGSEPTWCTELGCTVDDGSVTWRAIRGPYTFWRKLRTIPEQVTIPYVRVHISAPEAGFCPSSFANRYGIGIDNIQ
jgi:hypothetical protein